MMVTAVVQQKRNPEKQNIFIDGTFAFALTMQDVRYFKLKEGAVIAQETYDFIQENLIYIQAQDTVLHYLGYKMRTETELRRKLETKEFAPDVIARVMEFLKKYGYCNDRKYAESYVKERLRLQPRSAYLLKMELKQKGISEQIAQEVLAESNLDETADAVRWIVKKTKGNLQLDEKQKKKLYGFLQRKGYHWDIIEEALRKAAEAEEV